MNSEWNIQRLFLVRLAQHKYLIAAHRVINESCTENLDEPEPEKPAEPELDHRSAQDEDEKRNKQLEEESDINYEYGGPIAREAYEEDEESVPRETNNEDEGSTQQKPNDEDEEPSQRETDGDDQSTSLFA